MLVHSVAAVFEIEAASAGDLKTVIGKGQGLTGCLETMALHLRPAFRLDHDPFLLGVPVYIRGAAHIEVLAVERSLAAHKHKSALLEESLDPLHPAGDALIRGVTGLLALGQKEKPLAQCLAFSASLFGPEWIFGEAQVRAYLGIARDDPAIHGINVILVTLNLRCCAHFAGHENHVYTVD